MFMEPFLIQEIKSPDYLSASLMFHKFDNSPSSFQGYFVKDNPMARIRIYPKESVCCYCKKPFIIKDGRYAQRKYCSHKCYSISKLGTTQSEESKMKRSNTLKGRKRPPFSLEWRKKISLNNKSPKGADCHLWRGGIWDKKNYYHYKTLQYKLWREEVFKRDNWLCQICKNKNKKGGAYLHPHHIKLYAYYPELRYDINNGITLCSSCHLKLHRENWGKKIVEVVSSEIAW